MDLRYVFALQLATVIKYSMVNPGSHRTPRGDSLAFETETLM